MARLDTFPPWLLHLFLTLLTQLTSILASACSATFSSWPVIMDSRATDHTTAPPVYSVLTLLAWVSTNLESVMVLGHIREVPVHYSPLF